MNVPHSLEGLILDGRYEIIQKIGNGGMADVYHGEDKLLGRDVAIKILHNNFAGDQEFVSRFKREAQAAGKLSHPNIVNMYDVGCDNGYYYIIMEYVDGMTLKEYMESQGQLTVEQAVKITIAIAEGIEHAHAMGIIHCDIKPHNILVTRAGRIKVTDFGIARAVNKEATLMYSNSVMGSAHYISPEQAKGKNVTVSSDIYSLGVLLYELLTGHVPFEGDTPISVALRHVQDRVTPPRKLNPEIPSLVEGVVLKCLAKQPENRYKSISEMISDLRMSQGYRANRSARPAQYDFATQIMPAVEGEDFDDYDDYNEEEQPKPTKKGRFAWLSRLNDLPTKYKYGGAAIAFVIAFLWAFLSFGNFWSNATVDVPNVVGKQVSVATRILEDHHLRVSTSEVSNSDVPAGQVISQSPEANASVKEQRTVHLVVSKGAGDITIPDLKGLTLDQARDKLKSLGLVMGKVTTGSDDSADDGVIINQGLQAGGKTSKGTPIDITINKAKPNSKVSVPNVIGMTVKDAKDALSAVGLSVGSINGSSDDKAIVSDMSPRAGSTLDEGSSVILAADLKEDTSSKKDDSSSSSSSNTTKGTVDITVPAGKQSQSVRIVQIDDNGSHTIFDGTGSPGERISKDITGSGNVRVQIYINGALVSEQSL